MFIIRLKNYNNVFLNPIFYIIRKIRMDWSNGWSVLGYVVG